MPNLPIQNIDPNQFIITRKRKLYKFALFANSSLCFEYEQWGKSTKADCLEIGAGTGLFSAQLAAKHPNLNFVAIDVKADRLQKGARYAEENKITNVKFLRARADQIDELFTPDSLDMIWVTFPDPFPRKRSAGRRLTHKTFLSKYQKLLKPTSCLYFKTDNQDLFKWSLEELVACHWQINELTFDLHESDFGQNLDGDYKIQTTYEKRWLAEGLSTCFVRARKPKS